MENCNSEKLNRALQNAGRRNGFDDIQAEFAAFRDFKLKWTRSYKWISFEVNDYLKNAPEHVMESLAETIFAKIRGEDGASYSKKVCDYLNPQEFSTKTRSSTLGGSEESARPHAARTSTCWTATGD